MGCLRPCRPIKDFPIDPDRQRDPDGIACQIEDIKPIKSVTESGLGGFDGNRQPKSQSDGRFAAKQPRQSQGGGKQQQRMQQGPQPGKVVFDMNDPSTLKRNPS